MKQAEYAAIDKWHNAQLEAEDNTPQCQRCGNEIEEDSIEDYCFNCCVEINEDREILKMAREIEIFNNQGE